MTGRLALHLIGLALALLCGVAAADGLPAGMVLVPAGAYRPSFRGSNDPREIQVGAFAMDAHPVTNAEYLEFVRTNPGWRRGAVKRLFADEHYLSDWSGDLEPGTGVATNAPVTWVSWFAAKAYAKWAGKRLPTTVEWEFAAAASATQADGAGDPEFRRQLAAFDAAPALARLPPVGSRPANFYGIHDLHGLLWEWVADFNTSMVTGDARGDSGLDAQLFCGSGAQGAKDTSDYTAFMRFGFRSSLKAAYTVHNLGFRCAKTL